MNFRLKRFLESTIPNKILFGTTIIIFTYISLKLAILGIFIFSLIDIVMLKNNGADTNGK